VPSFLPDHAAEVGDGDRFEKAVANETAQAEGVAYGLNKRARPAGAPAPDDAAAEGAEGAAHGEQAQPRERSFVERALEEKEREKERERAERTSGAGGARNSHAGEQDAAAFREDLARLPDSAPLEAYDDMPVEAFGEAMLRGMGWRDGGAVGRNSTVVVKPIEYLARPRLLGLGASAAADDAPPGHAAAGKGGNGGAPQREHMVLPVGPDGRVRNVRTLDEALVVREAAGARVGKRMCVIGDGPHAGLYGEVLALPEAKPGRSERASLRLERGGAVVTLRVKELADVGTREAVRATEALERARGGGGSRPEDASRAAPETQHQAQPEASPWLTPHVRVRVVSQRFCGGAHYLKKGTIVDVLSPGVCMLQLDDARGLLDAVPQRCLETLLPKRAGRVAVVSGRFRGQRAKMLSRDSGDGTANVQLHADFSMHTLPLDAIAEYVGPHDELD
jgi:G patch domain/KOW motif-containing protein